VACPEPDPLRRSGRNAASIAHLRSLFPRLFPNGNLLFRALIRIPEGVWRSTWYTSGWNQFRWPVLAYVPFWTLLAIGTVAAIAGLRRATTKPSTTPRSSTPADTTPVAAAPAPGRAAIAILVAFALGGAFAIWFVGLQTTQEQARIGFVGLPALAGLAAIGYERLRWPLVARFALPILGFVGTVVAIRVDVIGVFH
jgi:hypothetical protein